MEEVKNPTMEEVMDELQSRFLVNLPATELSSSERLFFQIEQCYWFYEDFYADQFKHLQHLKLNDFATLMFSHSPLLRPLSHQCDDMFQDFKLYQSQVPVVGCILLNKKRNKVLLVRNWKGTSWSFPRGKVNQGETDIECARREVLEECGYDVSGGLSEKLYIEFVQNQQRMRMYIAKNVPEDYSFAPQTRKEISLIQWFEFDSLPKKTWCVLPFMSRLKRWVSRDKSSKDKGSRESTRAASAPRNGSSNVLMSLSEGKRNNEERFVSTPHAKPSRRKSRGHFGTEYETATSYDGVNDLTFGTTTTQFSVEEMFRVNEQLTGQKFQYDGNPNDFGKTGEARQLLHPIPIHIKSLNGSSATSETNISTREDGQVFPAFNFNTVDIMAVMR
jgi:mRNA-decapping enzyme subunit 2